tara:strand:- start:5375 stop:6571 length:1197 start_codon:yes stop_codon:yes gene_type:complete
MNDLTPPIRFPEFEGDWKTSEISQRMTVFRGASPRPKGDQRYYGGNIPRLMIQDVTRDGKITYPCIDFLTQEGAAKSRLLKKGSLVLSCSGTKVAIPGILGIDACIHDGWLSFKDYNDVDINFLFLQFEKLHERIQGSATKGGVFNNLTTDIVKSMKIGFPSIEEQGKTASFLSVVDEKIHLLKERYTLLRQYKKGVMQKLFSQEIRFKDCNGQAFPDWNFRQGNELFLSVSDKKHNSDLPILAITQEHGAIPRDLINYQVQATDSSVASYKVVNKGDFIISLRSFQGGIEYSQYKGICSPAYIILRPCSEIVDDFYRYYLKTGNFIQEMKRRLEGIRDGKILSYKYFSEIKLPYPCVAEQQKIADFLQELDKKLAAVQQQIELTQTFKKGLLQQMFV